jgi:hypothetical protein
MYQASYDPFPLVDLILDFGGPVRTGHRPQENNVSKRESARLSFENFSEGA